MINVVAHTHRLRFQTFFPTPLHCIGPNWDRTRSVGFTTQCMVLHCTKKVPTIFPQPGCVCVCDHTHTNLLCVWSHTHTHPSWTKMAGTSFYSVVCEVWHILIWIAIKYAVNTYAPSQRWPNHNFGPAADTGDSAVSTQYCTFISVGRRCGVI
jgi:hypothetical protein